MCDRCSERARDGFSLLVSRMTKKLKHAVETIPRSRTAWAAHVVVHSIRPRHVDLYKWATSNFHGFFSAAVGRGLLLGAWLECPTEHGVSPLWVEQGSREVHILSWTENRITRNNIGIQDSLMYRLPTFGCEDTKHSDQGSRTCLLHHAFHFLFRLHWCT